MKNLDAKQIKKVLTKNKKKAGAKSASKVERFQRALKRGITFSVDILKAVDKFQAEHPLEGVFVVTLGSLTTVVFGTAMMVAGGLVLTTAARASWTALLTLNPELGRVCVFAAELGLSAVFVGGYVLVMGVIAAVRSVFRFVRWLGSKIAGVKGTKSAGATGPAILVSAH